MTIATVGSEVIECLRIAKMIERHGENFLRRVFTPAEIRFCSARAMATQHYAACWAAKNSVRKALGMVVGSTMNWRDIEIRSVKNGQATVRLGGPARDASTSQRINAVHVSLSASRTVAVAFAVLERDLDG